MNPLFRCILLGLFVIELFDSCTSKRVKHSAINRVCFAMGCCGNDDELRRANYAISVDSTLKYYTQKVSYDSLPVEVYCGKITTAFWDTVVALIENGNFKQSDSSFKGFDGAPSELIIYYANNKKRIKNIGYSGNKYLNKACEMILRERSKNVMISAKIYPAFETRIQFQYPLAPPRQLVKQLR